jgi:transketolase
MNAAGVGSTERCRAIRRRIIELSFRSRSAHLGSSLSCVELLDCAIAHSDIRPSSESRRDRDRLVISKGHAAMAYYAVLEAWGLLRSSRLENYLQNGTSLWGHVARETATPAIDASTGSLGHGLSLAAGFALAKRLRREPGRAFCLMSDGECDEGATWEAALFAGHHRLAGLVALVDYNKVQSIGTTSEVLELEPFADKWRSFRWEVEEVDGHDWSAISAALQRSAGTPIVLLAHTTKGKGLPDIEHTVASHYTPATHADVMSFDNAPSLR